MLQVGTSDTGQNLADDLAYPVHLVALGGPVAAGKTTTAAALCSELGWSMVSLSMVIADEALARGISTHRQDLQKVASEMMRDGAKEFVRRCLRSVGWTLGTGIIVDGIRQPEVFGAFAVEVLPMPSRLVFLEASFPLRLTRARYRECIDANGLRGIDSLASELRLEDVKNLADIVIDATAPTLALVEAILGSIRPLA